MPGSDTRRLILTIVAALLFMAGTASAQDLPRLRVRYDTFAAGATRTAGAVSGHFGLHVAKHVVLFGEGGRLQSLETPTTQPGLDQTIAATIDGSSAGAVQTLYSLGGVRVEMPRRRLLEPYVFSGIGAARLTSPALFTYAGGPILNENSQPADSQGTTTLIVRLGGGVQIPFGRNLVGDLGITVSRLPASQVETHTLTLGVVVKF